MSTPIYLVISSGKLRDYDKFEKLFLFYPEGITGLVKAYLNAYANPEYISHLLLDDIDSDPVEEMMGTEKKILNHTLELYEQSEDYRLALHSHNELTNEFLIELVSSEISQGVLDMVEEYLDVFSKYTCDVENLKWMGDSLILKASKFVSTSWFYS